MRLKDKLKLHGDVLENQEMKNHTTFRIGGKVRYIFYPFTIDDLVAALEVLKAADMPYKVVGKGSNLLWSDEDMELVAIFLDHYLHRFSLEDNVLECEAGCSIIQLAVFCRDNALSNLEFATGIPGTVGGCIFMNAGAYKRAMSDIVKEVQIIRNGELVWLSNLDMQFDYRYSIMKEHPDWIIVKARLNLQRGDKDEIGALMDDRLQRRRQSQPLDKPSAGSTFKNPDTVFAWKCIEDCNLRGYTIGGAMVSDKHCNFIVNHNNASFNDVVSLMSKVKEKVKETMDIELETEVEQFTWQSLKKK